MSRRDVFETAATLLVVLMAIAMLRQNGDFADSGSSVENEGWEEANEKGIWVGPQDAPIVITEFVDFECPFCATVAPALDSIIEEYGGEVSLVLQHYPLVRVHPYAEAAAVAVECADRQGRAWEMAKTILAGQDSLGVRDWATYSADALLPDPRTFSKCIMSPVDSFPRIAQGSMLAAEFNVRGTPTLWVNGVQTMADAARIRRRIDELR